MQLPMLCCLRNVRVLHDNNANDAKAVAIPLVFSKNSQAKNDIENDVNACVMTKKSQQSRHFQNDI